MLANPYGNPMVVSPYKFLERKVSTSETNINMDTICDNGRHCIHRIPQLRELALFRLNTAGEFYSRFFTFFKRVLAFKKSKIYFKQNFENKKKNHGSIRLTSNCYF